MGKLRTFAAAAVLLTLAAGSGCMVSQKKFDAEHQKTVDVQQRLDKARASLKAAEDALKDKISELTKKGEADLAMAKEQADALQTTIKNMQAAVAKLEQTSKQQAATIAERAKEAAEKAKEINMLKAQLSAEQDKVLKLTEELEAAKKAAPPSTPAQ